MSAKDKAKIATLERRIVELEAKVGLRLIPVGAYGARVLDVSLRKTRIGRDYWSIEIGDIDGYPGRKLWMNPAYHIGSPLGDLFREFDLELPDVSWFDAQLMTLVGRRVRVHVGTSTYEGRENNIVERIQS